MSRCSISFGVDEESITVEGSTVAEALAMKVEYLLNVGAEATDHDYGPGAPPATTPKASAFLSKVKGGTDG